MNLKRLIIGVSSLVLLSTIVLSAGQNVKIVVNGTPLKSNTLVKIENGKTLAPVREIAEALGADVEWDNDTKTVNIKSRQDDMGDKEGVSIYIGASTKFSEEEINDAIVSLKNNFDFPASTLKKIWYDEELSNKYVKLYLENGKGIGRGIKPENVIVLLSNFDVDTSATSEETVLTAGKTYENYQWVLIRDNKTSNWKVDSWGY